jgi:type III secretion system YscQ/HrcQ family protein
MRMVLAQAQWSAHDIAQWRVGTALRPSGGLRPDPNRLAIQLHIDRSVVFNATVVGEHLVVEDPVNPMEETPESPPPGSSAAHKPNAVAMAPPAPSAEDLLSAIECEVSFELGSMKLTVADIARLRSGQVMRLGVRLADQPVRIVVNGRPVARGELAALGDELVVVITDTRALPHV